MSDVLDCYAGLLESQTFSPGLPPSTVDGDDRSHITFLPVDGLT